MFPDNCKSVMCSHRVSIEWKSPYKESYTVNSHRKMFGDVFVTLVHALGCWKSELVHSFSIFSLDVYYTIFFNKASYVLKYKRIFKEQSR